MVIIFMVILIVTISIMATRVDFGCIGGHWGTMGLYLGIFGVERVSMGFYWENQCWSFPFSSIVFPYGSLVRHQIWFQTPHVMIQRANLH